MDDKFFFILFSYTHFTLRQLTIMYKNVYYINQKSSLNLEVKLYSRSEQSSMYF